MPPPPPYPPPLPPLPGPLPGGGGPHYSSRGGRHHPPPLDDAPPPALGSIHRARVEAVRPFGVFVSLPGQRRHALAHHTAVAPADQGFALGRDDDEETRVRALSYWAPPGGLVWAKVTSTDPGPDFQPRIGVSLAGVDQDTGADVGLPAGGGGGGGGGLGGRPGGGPARPLGPPPALASIHRGSVSAVMPFGVFVTLDQATGGSYRVLVPSTHVADHLQLPDRAAPDAEKAAALAAVVAPGDPVFVKVQDVAPPEEGVAEGAGRPPKIAASMRAVDQRSGADLDPAGATWRRGGGGGGPSGAGGGPPAPSRPPVGAGAGGTVAGADAVAWGHLAADVADYGGTGRAYDLLTADADELAAEARSAGAAAVAAAAAAAAGRPVSPPPVREIKTVEEALAILERYGSRQDRRAGGPKDKRKQSKKGRRRRRSSTPISSGSG